MTLQPIEPGDIDRLSAVFAARAAAWKPGPWSEEKQPDGTLRGGYRNVCLNCAAEFLAMKQRSNVCNRCALEIAKATAAAKVLLDLGLLPRVPPPPPHPM